MAKTKAKATAKELAMTIEEVQSLMRVQSAENLKATNDHRITLGQAIIPPERISVISRKVENGESHDEILNVWLVGKENLADGYKIILRDDGKFGLASSGFPNEKHLVLDGWYGSLLTTFLAI